MHGYPFDLGGKQLSAIDHKIVESHCDSEPEDEEPAGLDNFKLTAAGVRVSAGDKGEEREGDDDPSNFRKDDP